MSLLLLFHGGGGGAPPAAPAVNNPTRLHTTRSTEIKVKKV